MGDEFRERIFTPFVLPLTIIGLMLVIGISLSRVLLAVSELGAAFVALLAAGYIMAMAFFIEARRRITPRALGIALAVGFIGVVASGAVASAVGMREIGHHGAEEGHGGEGEGEGEASAASPGLPPGEVFVAVDIAYEEAPDTVPAGEVTFVIDNQGQVEHNVVIEELGDELVVEAQGGESATGDVTLEPGEYTYYCDIAGHREAGMEGTLTASEDAEPSGGGEPAGGGSEPSGGEETEAGTEA